MQRTFYRGKLLLFGEYAVLHGALALAAPSLYGQTFHVTSVPDPGITWKALDETGKSWLEVRLDKTFAIQGEANEKEIFLAQLLKQAFELKGITTLSSGYEITAQVNYPRMWGLGSSATLYAFLGDLLKIDPYALFFATSKGSGFDIACATSDIPVFYSISGQRPQVEPASINPLIREKLLFVYRGHKQDSLSEVNRVNGKAFTTETLNTVSKLSTAATHCNNLEEWTVLMDMHEEIISGAIGLECVKPALFKDFKGSIKSLGAWGGDFIMAASSDMTPEEMAAYFLGKGYPIAKRWNELLV